MYKKIEDCVNYIKNLIFDRTFQCFKKEKRIELNEVSDEWVKKYNIDYYIECEKGYIGIQIKPTGTLDIQVRKLMKGLRKK